MSNKKADVKPTTEKNDKKSTKEPTEHEKFIAELRRSAEKLGHLHPVLKSH